MTLPFPTPTSPRSLLALDTILQQKTRGIPGWLLNIMQHDIIERLAGTEPGSYRQQPHRVYLQMQRNCGTCYLDQYLAENPLTLGDQGFESHAPRTATTGMNQILLDGICIDSPEAVVEHLEKIEFPRLQRACLTFDETARVQEIIAHEVDLQLRLGPEMLKGGYEAVAFPILAYTTYGYTNYFSAYALFPEVIERHFALQADLALLNNRALAQAVLSAGLPPLFRLDHDMADSRGTLVSIHSLERLWFHHFSRCLEPLLQADIRLIWHCDGNLVQMVPRLLAAGLHGFQGFQYEDGMDYPAICKLKDRQGRSLLIIAGVSVTRTLPFAAPADVRRELKWLVENGPKTGLFLGASSSIPPGTPWANIQALVEGLLFYQRGSET